MRLLAVLVALSYIINLLTVTVYSQYGEYGQYGVTPPGISIRVDKLVGKPNETKGGTAEQDYVDNLSSSDPRFIPGQEIFFKIKVKNTSDVKIKNVTVKDSLPDFIEPVDGPGSFDSNSRTITFSAGDLEIDEEKVFFLKMRLLSQEILPADQGLICLVNKAEAFDGGVSAEDTSQFCVEKEVLGVTAVPSAGPEMGMALLTGEILILGIGLTLKRISSNKV